MIENKQIESIINDAELDRDTPSEVRLRPKGFVDFIGQSLVKSNLKIFIEASKKRGEALEHILFYGPPGLGKTTLCNIISTEMGSNMYSSSGPAIEKSGDLASILTNLKAFDVLFIDEIHRLRTNIEEILYSAMEDGFLDIVIGKGPTARTMRINLEPFTLVGATTKLSSISSPMRDRFGAVMKLEFYEPNELELILMRTAKLLKIWLDRDGIKEISKRSRGTPRIANRILRRVRDYANIAEIKEVPYDFILQCLENLGINDMGLEFSDINLLKIIKNKFYDGPVGLSTLASALSEEESTIEEVYEPYLLKIGFLEKTAKGRKLSFYAKEYLKNLDKNT